VATHQNICAKTSQKTCKIFEPVKQQVKGNEADAFLSKGLPQTVRDISMHMTLLTEASK
jgi:hypothetical protein